MNLPKPHVKIHLSAREEEVLFALLTGKSNRQIADQLFVVEKTVKFHLTNIYRKLGVKSRLEAMVFMFTNPEMKERIIKDFVKELYGEEKNKFSLWLNGIKRDLHEYTTEEIVLLIDEYRNERLGNEVPEILPTQSSRNS